MHQMLTHPERSRNRGWHLLTGCCVILTDTKSRLRSLGVQQNPSMDGPLKASRRPSGDVEAVRVSRDAPEGLNPDRTDSDSPAASFNLRVHIHESLGLTLPIICTPEELLGETYAH